MITDMNINEWGELCLKNKEIIELKINGQIVYAISFLYSELSSIIPSIITDINANYGVCEEIDADKHILILCNDVDSINADITNIFVNEIIGNINTNASLEFKPGVNSNSEMLIGILIDSNNITIGSVKNSSSNKIIYSNYESNITCNNGASTNGDYKMAIEKTADIDAELASNTESSKIIAVTYKVGGMPTSEELCTAIKTILLHVISDIQDAGGISSESHNNMAIIKYPFDGISCDATTSNIGSFELVTDTENNLKQADTFLIFTNIDLQSPITEMTCTNGDVFTIIASNEIEPLTVSLDSILGNSNNITINSEHPSMEYIAESIYQCALNTDSNNEIGINYKCNMTYLLNVIDVCSVVDLDKTILTVFDTMMVF